MDATGPLSLLNVDVHTVIILMFWGNLSMGIVMLAYPIEAVYQKTRGQLRAYGASKFLQCAGWFLLFFRGNLPDLLSVNAGNTFLFFGFYFESLMMLNILPAQGRRLQVVQTGILTAGAITFNVLELLFRSPSLRVATGSFCNVAILLIPTTLFLFSPRSIRLKRIVGGYYFAFLLIMMLRGTMGFVDPSITLYSQTAVQNGTFIVLSLMLVIGGAGFLLLVKEDADREMERMASTDPLTGLLNRRRFMEDAGKALSWHKRAGASVCLLYLDIDDFKLINDRYGHKLGDEVLVQVARVLRAHMRSNDYCCRFGGEEFVVMLTVTDEGQGMLVANRILQGVREIVLPVVHPPAVTISTGLHAIVPEREDTMDSLIEHSDRALYEAKRNGKNRLALEPTSVS